MTKPNILWICTDQQRYDTLGCLGNNFVRTPNLDSLAQSGICFRHAYSQSPVCAPSRASFLTGRYPHTARCRQNGQMIPADEVLVTKLFRDAGYNCGLAGKLHIGPCHPGTGCKTEPRIDDGYSVFNWSHHPQGFADQTDGWANNEYHVWLRSKGLSCDTPPFRNSRHVQAGMPEEYHQTTWCTDRAIAFIEANTAHHTPWLFSLNYFDPHHPFDPPEEYLNRYLPMLDEIPLPAFMPGELSNKSIFQQREFNNGGYNSNEEFKYLLMSETEHRLVKAAYWAMVDLIDHQIGRLVKRLKELGQLEHTMILFTSDHGEMLGDHGIYMKGPHFYDCNVRVPLILSWPGQIKRGESEAFIELTDLAPTLLEAAGIPIWGGMQGRSFWKLLSGQTDIHLHREDVISEYYHAMTTHKNPLPFLTMLRTNEYKLICQHGQEHGELYDITSDTNETNNLWYDTRYADIRFKLLKRMCDRIVFTCDPLPARVAPY